MPPSTHDLVSSRSAPEAVRLHFTAVKNVRRGLLVAAIAVVAGLVVRVRGREAVPASQGGWRELEGPGFR